jgi:FkbM family methyltransferase
MENVGKSKSRNIEFAERFSRERIIQSLVVDDRPIIFDVGAHCGESIRFLKPLFPKSIIYSFEPDPDSFRILFEQNIENVVYLNLALSDRSGLTAFFRNKISHTNSLLKVNLGSNDSIGIATAAAKKDANYSKNFNSEIQVSTITLDEFCKKNSIGKIDLLKIDVQGAETLVLHGAMEMLAQIKAIIIEISFFDYYEKRTTFLDVEKFLQPSGFHLYSITEISNNPMNGRTDWVEVVYKK